MKRDYFAAVVYWLTWLTIPALLAHWCGDNLTVWFLASLAWPVCLLLWVAHFHPETLSVGPRR